MGPEKMHINNVFWTFQGEGMHSGRRALFVRMPYCNLKCPWCDTEFNSHKEWMNSELMDFATQEQARFAVITGGEPMMHKHTPRVVALLKQLGFEIACETNGMFPIVDGIDFVTCSPKGYGDNPFFVHPQVWDKVSEWKYVVEEGFDFALLDRHKGDHYKPYQRYSLSPEFGIMERSLERIFAFIKENPTWRISLQTHKFMNIP